MPYAERATAADVRFYRRPRWWAVAVVDIALSTFLVLLGGFGTGPATDNQSMGPAPVAAYVLAVLAGLAVLGWRRAPIAVFAVVGALTTGFIAAGYAFGPILVTMGVAALGMALRVPVRTTLMWSGGLAVAFAVASIVRVQVIAVDDWATFPRLLGWLTVPIAVGIAFQVRRRARVEVRSEQVRRAASEEQLRMAQDLHDVVGHGLAVIAMQAGVALHVLDRDPAKSRESLEAIRATSREALDGLRSELAVLTADPGTSATPRRPAPVLDDLDVLLDRVRAGGLRVDARIDVPDAPADVQAAAFRIVQESLTNVLRHAEADAAQVNVYGEAGMLVVEVADRGVGRAVTSLVDDGGGTGIDGMVARAEVVGGTLVAGPREDGGFVVRAALPCGSVTGSTDADDTDDTADTAATSPERNQGAAS